MGFSRQEYWGGLPFPSPMHESEKGKGSRSVVSDSVWPHRRQPTRLPRPWDSPGRNTRVGCHFLLYAWKWKVKGKSLSRVQFFTTPWTAAYQPPPSVGFSRQESWSGVSLPSPPLYFNKTLLHKSSEWSSLISGPGLNSPLEAKNPGVFSFSNNLSDWGCEHSLCDFFVMWFLY